MTSEFEKKYLFEIDDINLKNMRLDKFISLELKDLSRSRVVDLIKNNNIIVNNKIQPKSYKVNLGDKIEVFVPRPREYSLEPENILLDIIYEDEDLLVVNKPKNMVVHPASGNYKSTLVNALLYHCKDNLSGINGVARPGIVHRIDKNTSGLLIVAKNDRAHLGLSDQIKNHSFKRIYHSVVYGILKNNNGIINLPIGRSDLDRKKMSVKYQNSKEAITKYKIIKKFDKFSYIELELKTGRTHQIRVHMAHIGHPVAGDDVYGPKKVISELGGQCLHAKKIGFIHPIKNIYMEFDSELPDYFKNFLFKLENFD
ncbi:MAG: RluA family pseudouridine synthase [Oscillospiraceae bacterium]|nr:RluA family pseudouridine synthase [Oscillospiraceae bacterium]